MGMYPTLSCVYKHIRSSVSTRANSQQTLKQPRANNVSKSATKDDGEREEECGDDEAAPTSVTAVLMQRLDSHGVRTVIQSASPRSILPPFIPIILCCEARNRVWIIGKRLQR